MSKKQTVFPNGVDVGDDVVMIEGSSAPTNGASGTGAGEAGRGSIYIDRATGFAYQNLTGSASPYWSKIAAQQGSPSFQILRQTGVVVDGEKLTVGTDKFRVAIVNTDSTKNTSAALADEAETDYFAMTAHGLVVGDLLRVENEICRVKAVRSANALLIQRGVSGTTQASHLTNQDIYTEATPGAHVAGGEINIGFVTTLTAAQFMTVMADDISEAAGNIGFVSPEAGVGLFFTATQPGGVARPSTETLATTETFTNGAFDAATMTAGKIGAVLVQARVPTSAEVTAGKMYFMFPAAPTVISVEAYVTATPGVDKAWNGAVTVTGNVVIVDNASTTDWAATDTVVVTARV